MLRSVLRSVRRSGAAASRPAVDRALTAAAIVAALVALAFVPFLSPGWAAGLVALVILLWIGPALEPESSRVLALRRWPEASAALALAFVMAALAHGARWRMIGMAAAWFALAAVCVAWRERLAQARTLEDARAFPFTTSED